MSKPLDVLLVTPPSRLQVYQELSRDFAAIEPPVWSGLIATYLRQQSCSVAILDAEALGLTHQQTAEQIAAWNIKTVEGDLLDDGLYLWNKDKAFWRELLAPRYAIEKEADVYYAAHDQHNRLFLLTVIK